MEDSNFFECSVGFDQKFGSPNQKFGSADQNFGCLNPHNFLVGLTKILVKPTKLLFGCPNPHKRLEAPTKFL